MFTLQSINTVSMQHSRQFSWTFLSVMLALLSAAPKLLLGADSACVTKFKDFLGQAPPPIALNFTVINPDTGATRHYVAAVDGRSFFLREYAAGEDLSSSLSSTTMPQIEGFRGRNDDFDWEIVGAQVTKIPRSEGQGREKHEVLEGQLFGDRLLLDSILRLGAPEALKPGTFQWSNNTFTASLADNVEITVSGRRLTNLTGVLESTNGIPVALRCGANRAEYQYDSSGALPPGFPSTLVRSIAPQFRPDQKITFSRVSYASSEDVARLCTPEPYFRDSNAFSLVIVARNQRTVVQGTDLKAGDAAAKHYEHLRHLNIARFVVVAAVFLLPLAWLARRLGSRTPGR